MDNVKCAHCKMYVAMQVYASVYNNVEQKERERELNE